MAWESCSIRPIPNIDKWVAKTIKKMKEVDSFISYKNTHKSPFSEEQKLRFQYKEDVWTSFSINTKSWVPIFKTKEYIDLKEYIAWYWESENFMNSFKVYYQWDDVAFKRFQDKVKEDIDNMFTTIEKASFAETQNKYFRRLAKAAASDEYNDAQFLLMLFPDMREVLTDKALFQKYFWITMDSPKAWNIIKWTIAKKALVSTWIPDSTENITMWDKLPDCMKEYFFRNPVYIEYWDLKLRDPEWHLAVKYIENRPCLYIHKENFSRITQSDQIVLYNRLFDYYKEVDPEWAANLVNEFAGHNYSYWLSYWFEAIWVWAKKFFKSITSPIMYAAWLAISKWVTWFLSLLWLNSWMHLPRIIAMDKRWYNWFLSWDWEEFMFRHWFFENSEIDNLFSLKWLKDHWRYTWFSWFINFLWAKINQLAESQFFNIADAKASQMFYKKWVVSEYIAIYHPRAKTLEEFDTYLRNLPKEKYQEELNNMFKRCDDRMYIRYNSSVDQYRYTNYWVYVDNKYLQEFANIFSNCRWFYRRYMISAFDNFWDTFTKWRKSTSWKYTRDLYEQFYSGKISMEEVRKALNDRFTKNQDWIEFMSTFMYSFWLAKSIYKANLHWNWVDEENRDWSTMASEFFSLLKLFEFPIEAWERTDIWMILWAATDVVSNDATFLENLWMVWESEYKMFTKQMTKSSWMVKTLLQLISSLKNSSEDWENLDFEWTYNKVAEIMTSTIWWFWYYLQDEVYRWWFEEYMPKTQTALVKDIFWQRETALERYDELNKKWTMLESFQDWKAFSNRLMWNTPFVTQRNSWWIRDHSNEFMKDLKDLKTKDYYKQLANWELPVDVMNESDWLYLYNIATKHTVNDIEKITDDFLSDLTYYKDWMLVEWFSEDVKEHIRHKLMLESVDKDLFKEAVRLLWTAEAWHQANALQSLLYMESQTPWSWQKLLSYIMSTETVKEVYFSWRFWTFRKMENWKYNLEDQARLSEAFNIVWKEMAQKYFDYTYITDKEIWNQWAMKIIKSQWDKFSQWITDPNAYYNNQLWIKKSLLANNKKIENWEVNYITSTDLKEVFTLQSYIDIMAAEWEPNPYKLYNIFSKLFSESWNKDKSKLNPWAARAMLYKYNFLMDHIQDLWISDVEKNTMMSAALLQSDWFILNLMDNRTLEENQNDEVLQKTLHFLWWTTKEINNIADRYIKEEVQKEYLWEDPSTISLSWVTSTSKYWNKNWKQYYSKNVYFYDALKWLSKHYSKLYNRFYSQKWSNATQTYSQKEWEAKGFWRVVNRVWWWGGGSWWTRSEWESQEKASGYTKQRRWAARPFVNRWDLDKIPDRKYKPQNRRTRSYAVGSKVRNKLIPGRRRRIKAVKWDTASMT